MNYEDFFNIIDINDDEKDSAIMFMNYRGIEENIKVAKYIQSFKRSKATYAEVASTFRYDKRIRRIIYKYLGVIEEISRSFIANKYELFDDIPSNIRKVICKKELDRCKNKTKTNDVLSFCLFATPIKMIEKISKIENIKILPNIPGYKIKNREALVDLRNQVGHNNFLLNNRNLKEVKLPSGEVSSSLVANLRNMLLFLPNEMRQSFKDEINNAHYKKAKKFAKQTEWKLLSNIVIKL